MKRKRLEISNELIREIWSYVDIDTRIKNKIVPFKISTKINFLKPKVIIADNVVNHFNYNYHYTYNTITKITEMIILVDDLIIVYKDNNRTFITGDEHLYFLTKTIFELAKRFEHDIVLF
jgi:hypothetical protein